MRDKAQDVWVRSELFIDVEVRFTRKCVHCYRLKGEVRSILTRNYHEKVIDHYENPRNVRSFDKSDTNIGTGLVGAPACGDMMKLKVKF
jgi:hypothetical protein